MSVDFIANEEVLKRSQMLSVDNMIRIRRLRWAGHVSRMDKNRVPLQVAFSELVEGKRAQQKPKCRWMDILKEDFKKLGINITNWRDIAANRNQWRDSTVNKIRIFQEITIKKKEADRNMRHEVEESYTWKCPLCDFLREGRNGRRYVLSHITQRHPETSTPGNTAQTNKCTVCNFTCASKAGWQSHMRNKHKDVHQAVPRQPIKLIQQTVNQSQRNHNNNNNQTNTQHQLATTSGQHTTPQQLDTPQRNQHQCRACQRICKSKAGLTSHLRNPTCKAAIEEMATSDTMNT